MKQRIPVAIDEPLYLSTTSEPLRKAVDDFTCVLNAGLTSDQTDTSKVVYPEDANIVAGRLSILVPIGN